MPDPDYSDLLPGVPPERANQLITDALKKNLSSPSSIPPPMAPSGDGAGSDLWPYALGVGGAAAAKATLAAKAALTGKGAATLATMAGPMARLANTRKLDKFNELSTTPEKAFDATGWFKDPLGDPKFEISDKGMTAKPVARSKQGVATGVASDFIDHPELFENYPQAKGVPVTVDPKYGSAGEGIYNTSPEFRIGLGGDFRGELSPLQQAGLLHELGGHYVNFQEGGYAALGSSPKNITEKRIIPLLTNRLRDMQDKGIASNDPELQFVLKALKNVKDPNTAFRLYKELPGEVGPRNVADRYVREKYGWPTASNGGPHTTDIDQAVEQFRKQGLNLKPAIYDNEGFPSRYDITSLKNPRYPVDPANLPQYLRALHDRLPIGGYHRYPTMAGEFKYPWKTEDLPRTLQRNWVKPLSYEEVPPNWLPSLIKR